MADRQATVLFVDDELSLHEDFSVELGERGHRLLAAKFADDVLDAIESEARIDVAVIDLQLPMEKCTRISALRADGGRALGLVLAERLRRKFPHTPVIFWTGVPDAGIRHRARRFPNSCLIPKQSGPDPVLDAIAEALAGQPSGTRPRTFIVHGHDEDTMQAVNAYLQDTLGFPQPVVLRDEPAGGRTIIEKLEAHAYSVDLVFVLLTPDDKAVPLDAPSEEVYRSRPNVIFELGYFLGLLGRGTGRVILLYRSPIELPSDIWGMSFIDISDGIEAARPAIEREIAHWLR